MTKNNDKTEKINDTISDDINNVADELCGINIELVCWLNSNIITHNNPSDVTQRSTTDAIIKFLILLRAKSLEFIFIFSLYFRF
jgi:hypothetical protein